MSKEMRLLANRWTQNRQTWPQFLEWLEIKGLRGWDGQRIGFDFPIVALVGENGTGKSTVLQTAAAFYRPPAGSSGYFASDFFPSTAWETITAVQIRGFCRQGQSTYERSVRKPTTRWLGNPDRRERNVAYLDLRRTQPIYARIGYKRIAKSTVAETGSVSFDSPRRDRASSILGKDYQAARHATTDLDPSRSVPVLAAEGIQYSGFHQGAGENAIADLLAESFPNRSLVLVDEIETSLHPRAQRRLIRDFATMARLHHLQILLTTHSPYVLEELPPEARIYIADSAGGPRNVLNGVSADYAMTFMDDVAHPELELYVEDMQAKILVEEILIRFVRNIVRRIQIVPFGAANVGQALGQMVEQDRFSRPTVVVLDGDQMSGPGTYVLPGGDAPERVVFSGLNNVKCCDLAERTNRDHPTLVDAVTRSMTAANHHDWILAAAKITTMGGDELWRAMCSVWVEHCLDQNDVQSLLDDIEDRIGAS